MTPLAVVRPRHGAVVKSGPMNRTRYALAFLLSLVLSGLLSACAGASAPHVVLGDQRFNVAVAERPEDMRRGLMFVEEMDDKDGMLFIFKQEAPRSFWMKNTRIPLDIFYFDRRLALVSVQEDVPPCRADPCPSYPSEGPAKYVLELNAGWARRLGVKPGDVMVVNL